MSAYSFRAVGTGRGDGRAADARLSVPVELPAGLPFHLFLKESIHGAGLPRLSAGVASEMLPGAGSETPSGVDFSEATSGTDSSAGRREFGTNVGTRASKPFGSSDTRRRRWGGPVSHREPKWTTMPLSSSWTRSTSSQRNCHGDSSRRHGSRGRKMRTPRSDTQYKGGMRAATGARRTARAAAKSGSRRRRGRCSLR